MILILFNIFLCIIEFLYLIIQVNAEVFRLIKNVFVSIHPKDVKNKVVVITGGAKGLGRQLAFKFSKLGANLILLDIDKQIGLETQNIINSNGGKAKFIQVDISDYDQVKNVFQSIYEKHNIFILINNAGTINNFPLDEISHKSIERTIKTNLLAHFWTVKCVLPKMLLNKKGHIVAIASNFGLLGRGQFTDYTASKFGVVGFMESLEDELRTFHKNYINFTTICPAAIETGFTKTIDTRFPRLLPIMQPEYAAEKIVQSILRNEQFVIIPRGYNIMYKVLLFFPRNIRHLFIEYIGSTAQPNKSNNSKLLNSS